MPEISLAALRGKQSDRRMSMFLMGALAIAIFLTLSGWAYLSGLEQRDQQQMALTAEQKLLAERIAARSFEVANALSDELVNRQTFSDLVRSIENFAAASKKLKSGDPQSGLDPVPASVQARLDVVIEAWTRAQPHLQSLVAVRGIMPGARAYQTEFQTALGDWMADLDALLDQMRAARLAPEQTNQALRLGLDLQRMREGIDALFGGVGDAAALSRQLIATLARLGDGLQ
jgi:hypothetical protein